MLFVKTDCPICIEDQVGPPTVAPSCGHEVCIDVFQRLGGKIGGREEEEEEKNSFVCVDFRTYPSTTIAAVATTTTTVFPH